MAADEGDMFGSTRGKVLLLLCGGAKTVNDLMDALNITDNAVRAQLANLQSEGLVRPLGLRPGTRKPHVEYELTPKARRLLPNAYEPVLRALVDVLQVRLPEQQMRELVKDVAGKLLGELFVKIRASEPRGESKFEQLQHLASDLPGIRVEQSGAANSLTVRACGCPLAALTAGHPVICDVIAQVLSDVLGVNVQERCDRREWPQCCFEIRPDDQA